MTCTYCGTLLPPDAMFCGECGRSVVVTAVRSSGAPRAATKRIPLVEAEPAFLASVSVPKVDVPNADVPNADVPKIDLPNLLDESSASESSASESSASESSASESSAPGVDSGDSRETAVIEPLLLAELLQSPLPQSEILLPEIDLAAYAPKPVPKPAPSAEELHDIEATRIVRGTPAGARFVLQFSTGESHSVFGTGLIGRNPVPEPGEYFDSRIAISDPGKSVSKTHLEFGQVDGQFWILDRFSGNGTIVRQPDVAPVRCDGGKRYIVPRGARIDIGEQFLIVS